MPYNFFKTVTAISFLPASLQPHKSNILCTNDGPKQTMFSKSFWHDHCKTHKNTEELLGGNTKSWMIWENIFCDSDPTIWNILFDQFKTRPGVVTFERKYNNQIHFRFLCKHQSYSRFSNSCQWDFLLQPFKFEFQWIIQLFYLLLRNKLSVNKHLFFSADISVSLERGRGTCETRTALSYDPPVLTLTVNPCFSQKNILIFLVIFSRLKPEVVSSRVTLLQYCVQWCALNASKAFFTGPNNFKITFLKFYYTS